MSEVQKLPLGREAEVRWCVIHPAERATAQAQGIDVCSNCYYDYRDEWRMADGNLRRRPFLQQLIKASINAKQTS